MRNTLKENNFSRRQFIKAGGVAGAILSLFGVAGAGLSSGKNTDSYTGWERYTHGDGQFFNRKPFRVDEPTYIRAGQTRRIKNYEKLGYRKKIVNRLLKNTKANSTEYDSGDLIAAITDTKVREFYQKRPDLFEEILLAKESNKKQKQNWKKFRKEYILADAWSEAHSSLIFGNNKYPRDPDSPPEIWDFQGISGIKIPFKSPGHASALIKAICHTFGATLVGITRLNPDWVYDQTIRGAEKGQTKVPVHWKYAIVFGVAHEWDTMYANPTYGTSYDGYSQLRVIGGKLEAFIRHLGYPARAHIPPGSYDIVMPR